MQGTPHAVNDFRKLCNIGFNSTDNVSELTARINDGDGIHHFQIG